MKILHPSQQARSKSDLNSTTKYGTTKSWFEVDLTSVRPCNGEVSTSPPITTGAIGQNIRHEYVAESSAKRRKPTVLGIDVADEPRVLLCSIERRDIAITLNAEHES